MNIESQNAARLLEALQDAMSRLSAVWNHYMLRGTQPQRPHLALSGRPFRIHEKISVRELHGSVAIGLAVRGADERDYDLCIDMLWDSQGWTITTQAWVDAEEKGQALLRELPQHTTPDLEGCIAHLHSAVDDLMRFDDLVPSKATA